MHPTAPHPESTQPLPPPQDSRSGIAVPYYIAAILDVVRVLLGYGKHLDHTLPEQAAHPRFPSLAGGFGTHDLRRILLTQFNDKLLQARHFAKQIDQQRFKLGTA